MYIYIYIYIYIYSNHNLRKGKNNLNALPFVNTPCRIRNSLGQSGGSCSDILIEFENLIFAGRRLEA